MHRFAPIHPIFVCGIPRARTSKFCPSTTFHPRSHSRLALARSNGHCRNRKRVARRRRCDTIYSHFARRRRRYVLILNTTNDLYNTCVVSFFYHKTSYNMNKSDRRRSATKFLFRWISVRKVVTTRARSTITQSKMSDNAVWKAVKPYMNGGLSGMGATCVIQPLDSTFRSNSRRDKMMRLAPASTSAPLKYRRKTE